MSHKRKIGCCRAKRLEECSCKAVNSASYLNSPLSVDTFSSGNGPEVARVFREYSFSSGKWVGKPLGIPTTINQDANVHDRSTSHALKTKLMNENWDVASEAGRNVIVTPTRVFNVSKMQRCVKEELCCLCLFRTEETTTANI